MKEYLLVFRNTKVILNKSALSEFSFPFLCLFFFFHFLVKKNMLKEIRYTTGTEIISNNFSFSWITIIK